MSPIIYSIASVWLLRPNYKFIVGLGNIYAHKTKWVESSSASITYISAADKTETAV